MLKTLGAACVILALLPQAAHAEPAELYKLLVEKVAFELRAKSLLKIVENPNCSIDARCEAAGQLGALKNRSAVPGLVAAMKANKGDHLMLAIISALGNIGDARALPALRYVEAREDVEFHGSIYAALDRVIYYLDKVEKGKGK